MGSGVEIEEDIIRLRRRKLEYEADAARRTGPRRLRIRFWVRHCRPSAPEPPSGADLEIARGREAIHDPTGIVQNTAV
jgi:hypothetical protein